MRHQRKPAQRVGADQLALPLRGESGRFLSVHTLSMRGLSGPGSAGADRWAAECLTAKADTTPVELVELVELVEPDGVQDLSDAGSVDVLKLLVLAGFVLAVGTTYMQHPRLVQLAVGAVVTVVTVAVAWVVATRVRDMRPVGAPRTSRPTRPILRWPGDRRALPEHRSENLPDTSGWTAQVISVESLTHQVPASRSLPSSVPAGVVLWETLKGTRRRRKLRRATAGRASAPMPRRSGRSGRRGGGRR